MGNTCCCNNYSRGQEDGRQDLKRPNIAKLANPCDKWVASTPFGVTLCTAFVKIVDASTIEVTADKLCERLKTPA